MYETELLFNLFYLFMCVCIIYPSDEFQRAGLTIEQLGSSYLGEEHPNFVEYHQRRTSLNMMVHACLPAFYFLLHGIKFTMFGENTGDAFEYNMRDIETDFQSPKEEGIDFRTVIWNVAQRISLLVLLVVPAIILNWHQQNWKRHPITNTLKKYLNDEHMTIDSLVSHINREVRW